MQSSFSALKAYISWRSQENKMKYFCILAGIYAVIRIQTANIFIYSQLFFFNLHRDRSDLPISLTHLHGAVYLILLNLHQSSTDFVFAELFLFQLKIYRNYFKFTCSTRLLLFDGEKKSINKICMHKKLNISEARNEN